MLLGAVDGAGHGPLAEAAADALVLCCAEDPGAPMEELILRGHLRLRGTRGAVVSLAHITPGALVWSGVGNVAGAIFRADGTREGLIPRAGVVGHRLGPLRVVGRALLPGDLLAFATDGVHPGFSLPRGFSREPAVVAAGILAAHARFDDDALVVAALAGTSP
jgi:negative regulator of sigma-B (phosphoserine phosphatase)